MPRPPELATLKRGQGAFIIVSRIARYLFILAAVYFVLFGGTYYYQIFAVRVFHHLFATAILSVWLIVRLARGRGLPVTPLNPLLYLCVIVWFAAALLSLDPRMALENLWFPITNLMIFFVIVDLLQSGREQLVVETQFLIAALVVMLAGVQLGSWWFGWGFATPAVGWASVLGGDVPLPLISPKLFVPLGVTTWLAAYTAPLVIVAVAWGWSARRRDGRMGLWLLGALLLIVMLLTGSRGGWISLGAGAAVFAALQVIKDARLQRFVRRYALPLIIAIVVIAAVGALMLYRLSSDSGHATGDILRFDLWRGAVQIAADHPLLGVGPGEFGRAYRLTRDPTNVDNRLGTAHNLYLNTLAETGVIGAAVAIALGVMLLWSWWKCWRATDSPVRKLHLEGALAALIGFGAQSFFDTFTSAPLALLALGLTAYCVTTVRTRIDPSLRGSRAAGVASLIVLLGFGAGLIRSDQAQAAFREGVSGSLDAAQQAVALDPSLTLYRLQVAYLIGEQGTTDEGVAAYQAALTLEPTWDRGWINLAALYQRQGDVPAALDALQRAIDIDNRNPALLLWARLAEASNSAPPDAIVDAYVRYIRTREPGVLPLTAFWWQTDLRQQALYDYAADLPLDLRYRVIRAHDPAAAAALVPADPQTASDWWVVGEAALESGDAQAADAAFTQVIQRTPAQYRGDPYASRARARLSFDPAGAARDLDLAVLLGTYYESPNAVRAELAPMLERKRALLAAAVPPRVIDQNFEGVLFAGRVASFDALPEMRAPGSDNLQPWYDLAASYLDTGEIDAALNVYRAILERAPDEARAQTEIDRLTEAG